MEETNKYSDYSQGAVLHSLKNEDISVMVSANSAGKGNQFKSDDVVVYQEALNDDYNAGISFK